MIITIIICIAYAWIFYEAKNAPLVDDDGNIIEDKTEKHDNN
jgi:hypothetical protein